MIGLPHISKKFLMRLAIFVACIIIICLAAPGSDGEYEYAVGKPWNYDPLIATTDIQVYDSDENKEKQLDSLEQNYKPIFQRNDKTATEVVNEFKAALQRHPDMAILHMGGKINLPRKLEEIYSVGIIDTRGNDNSAEIRLRVSDTKLKNELRSNFYTFHTAYDELIKSINDDSLMKRVLKETGLTIRPNIMYDSAMNTLDINRERQQINTRLVDEVFGGTKIIDRGEIVTPRIKNILDNYLQKLNTSTEDDSTHRLTNLGAILTTIIIFGLLFVYLSVFRPDYFSNLRIVLMLSIIVTTFVLFAFIMTRSFANGIYIVPFTIIPIILLVFLDSRTAFFAYLVTLILCAATTHYIWDFLLIEIVAGFVALITIRELSKRSQLIRAALFIFIAYSLTYIATQLMMTGEWTELSTGMFGGFAINAVLISFAYILIFLIEKTFGFISRVTLVELSDINHPVLRELSEECPGTFQHSMAVSNIAAAAAGKVGANVQLVRAGALYHDIGKISNPAFFTENQHGINPHDSLSPIQSARIVIGHVTEGVKRADKAKLPSRLRDFILEHHGRGKAKYFYTTYCNQHPGEDVDPAPFTYPGPNPRTLESSILMMADSVEAASRSLTDHSPESIQKLVDKIIDSQVIEGLHNDSPISFRDIREIKKSFASTLRTMYHSRISYPEAKEPTAAQ